MSNVNNNNTRVNNGEIDCNDLFLLSPRIELFRVLPSRENPFFIAFKRLSDKK